MVCGAVALLHPFIKEEFLHGFGFWDYVILGKWAVNSSRESGWRLVRESRIWLSVQKGLFRAVLLMTSCRCWKVYNHPLLYIHWVGKSGHGLLESDSVVSLESSFISFTTSTTFKKQCHWGCTLYKDTSSSSLHTTRFLSRVSASVHCGSISANSNQAHFVLTFRVQCGFSVDICYIPWGLRISCFPCLYCTARLWFHGWGGEVLLHRQPDEGFSAGCMCGGKGTAERLSNGMHSHWLGLRHFSSARTRWAHVN